MKKILMILVIICVAASVFAQAPERDELRGGGPERTYIHLPDNVIADYDLTGSAWFGVRKLTPWTNTLGTFVDWPSDIYYDPIVALSQPEELILVGDFAWGYDSHHFPEGYAFRTAPGGHYKGELVIPDVAGNMSNGLYLSYGRVKVISFGACANCTELTKVVLPPRLKEIRRGAFYGCTSLEEVDGNGARDVVIFHYAFQGCTNLKKIDLTFAGRPWAKDYCYPFDSIFADCPKLEEVTIYANNSMGHCLRGRTHASLRRINLQLRQGVETESFTSSDVFFPEEYKKATLVVPDDYLEHARTTSPWNKFRNIVTTSELAGIENTESARAVELVNIDGGEISLIDHDTVVEVFGVSGAKVAELNSATPILYNARGYYILRSNAGIQKIYVD